jgi:two-component system invasion response regulator UvrY
MEQTPSHTEGQNLKPINVAIADDHRMIRDFLVANIGSLDRFAVVAVAENGAELIAALERLDAVPDICIIDISMPIMNGYEAQLIIKKRWPQIKSLAMSIFNEQQCIIQMLQNGSDGFISKNGPPWKIEEALTAIFDDGYYHGQISQEILNATGKLPKLTEREKEYLTLLCSEVSMDEIAGKMAINIRTVEHYRDNVYRKLQVNNKADVIFYVKKTGIVYMNA